MTRVDQSRAGWPTSSYSGQDSNCVETADDPDRVLVRDTEDRGGAMLAVPAAEWRRFTSSIK